MSATRNTKEYAKQWRQKLKSDPERWAEYRRKRKQMYDANREHILRRERERYITSIRDVLKRRESGNKRAIAHAITQYKANAKRRGYEWKLTDEEAEWFLFQPCYYCGVTPSWGIDRFDNDPLYDLHTVVPCCKIDNTGKGKISLQSYDVHLQRVTEWRMKKKDEL